MMDDDAARLCMTDRGQRQIVEEFARRMRKALGENLLRLHWFGSRARSAGDEDADFDLLVETRDPLSDSQRDALADAAIDISADCGVLLDVHCYTQAELRGVPYSRTPFVQAVLEEGVAL